MKVNIHGEEIDYVPDYPEGWKFSANDPFKFPVVIGKYTCFIKRFELKGPEDISGWELLQRLIGKTENNLAEIYDIRKVDEKGNDIYYMFFNYLEGTTMDRYLLKKSDLDLVVLTESLFSAISSLRKYGFWFADFCEKNIFCISKNSFALVDLDSTQKMTDRPDNDMYGNKDYWILVFRFFKEILNVGDVKLADVNGIDLNYLQIPFLILRLKMFFRDDQQKYNSTGLFNILPQQLDKLSPVFRNMYASALNKGDKGFADAEIEALKSAVQRIIINNENINELVMAPINLPVINQFSSTKKTVDAGEPFTLKWDTSNADKVELYKNGAMFQRFENGESAIDLKDFEDGIRDQSNYQLIAYKENKIARSDLLVISQKKSEAAAKINTEKVKPANTRWVWIVAGVIVALALVYFLLHNMVNSTGDIYIEKRVLRKGLDSTLTIHGKNFPSEDKIRVYINLAKADILQASEDSLLIALPTSSIVPVDDTANVTLNYNNTNHEAGGFILLAPVTTHTYLSENNSVTFTGKYLDGSNINAYLNGQELTKLGASKNSYIAKLPLLNDSTQGQTYEITLTEDGKTIYSDKFVVRYDTLSLAKATPGIKWSIGQLNNATRNVISNMQLITPVPTDVSNGYGGMDYAVPMEDSRSYNVIKFHPPHIGINNVIVGTYNDLRLFGKKTFNADVGFVNGSTDAEGITFLVTLHYKLNQVNKDITLINQAKTYSGGLLNVVAQLPDETPDVFSLDLQVNSGSSPMNDWAAWVNPMVVSRRLAKMPKQ